MNISFSGAGFDAVICLNGILPSSEVLQSFAHIPLVAADGATDSLLASGVVPEFVIGDMDSVSLSALDTIHGIAELIVQTDQNTTDFEKALLFARDQMWHNLLVVGIHGGDLEHTLNNWSVLMRHSHHLNLTALDRDRYAIPLHASFSISLKRNEIVSLIPQPFAQLTTEGLVWHLSDEPLSLGEREGARNCAITGQVQVHIHAGSLLLVCDARLPLAPRFDDY